MSNAKAIAADWLTQARDGRCFTDDLLPPDCLHAAFVRSPHAHALIDEIDTDSALSDGVLAVLTAQDIPPGIRPIPCIVPITNRDGSARADPPRTLLANGRVRHEGEAVAMVIGRTVAQARRGAANLRVRYRALPAVSDSALALEPDAPQVWDQAPGNLCFDWEMGDRAAAEAVFQQAAHVVKLELRNNRIVVSPLETRNAIGYSDPLTGRKVLVSATQGVHWVRKIIAVDVLNISEEMVEVVTPRVGGGFGSKIFVYPEQVLVLLAAERLGAPVKWVGSRSEAFLSDTQGRDQKVMAAMALDADGRILAVRADTLSNLGAHLSNYAPFNATTCGAPMLGGCYRVGLVYARVRGVMTHTPPVDSYRGAGRPEANYVIERLMDHAARKLGLDRAEIRRRNVIRSQDLPCKTATGLQVDSGMFDKNMELALALASYVDFPKRRQESLVRGRLRGIGFANFMEANGGLALARLTEVRGKPRESARVAFQVDGAVRLDVGTQCCGQGHADSYAKVLSKALDLAQSCVVVHEGSTALLRQGNGTGGSKSLLAGSTAILLAADEVLAKARQWAAAHWRVDESSLDWQAGTLTGPGGRASLSALVEASECERVEAHPFDTESTATIQHGTYGNGCHVCEVEVDPETGVTTILHYVAVNDFGTLVAPDQVRSQLTGGITQGIGQALYEDCQFDTASGHLLTHNLGNYHLPQASELPVFDLHFNGMACSTNRLGVKGCGESGASAAPPAVVNAVQDALAPHGGAGLQMPATPSHVWELLHQSQEPQ